MKVNKVVLENSDITAIAVDLTSDTATVNDVVAGKTFHLANGETAIGAMPEVKDYGPDIVNRTISSYVNNNISFVGDYAFASCKNLSYVSLNNCLSIGNYAFANCDLLTSCYLPKCEYLGYSCFYRAPFTSISLPNCKIIGENGFQYNLQLTSAFLPLCLRLDRGAFTSCSSLANISLYSVCHFVGEAAFAGCNLLPDWSYKYISAFWGRTFYSCYSLSEVVCPYVSNIGDYNFYNCQNLRSIEVPFLSSLGGSVFNNCTSLRSFLCGTNYVFASSVFYNCHNLESVYILNTYSRSLTKLTNTAFVNTPMSNSDYLGYYGSIYVASNLLEQYKSSPVWSDYADRITAIPESFKNTYIFPAEFWAMPDIYSFPSDRQEIRYICASAFAQTSISSLELSQCEAIGPYAFGTCKQLTDVSLPNCDYIDSFAFTYCSALARVYLNNCKVLNKYAFSDCTSLSILSIPECEILHNQAVTACKNLKSLEVPKCRMIYEYAFLGCVKISDISLPKCEWMSGGAIFSSCISLTKLVVGTDLSTLCRLDYSTNFRSTPIGNSSYLGYYGSVYVPDSLVEQYKVATNWIAVADRITGISNLPNE